MKFAKRPASISLSKLHGLPLYRKVVRYMRPTIEIKQASECERRLINAWLNPNDPQIPSCDDPNVIDFIAKKGREIVGFVQMLRSVGEAESKRYGLFSLTVKPLYRGMGIGEKLALRVVDEAKKEGAKELVLFVFEDNHRAIALYRKLGFAKAILDEFEEKLEKEKEVLGRRRITMLLEFQE